ncbi:protein kinase [Nocardia terpenica]|uniref:serine/threonine-protein kinase n=1 Tax=Nocardia terpenica TaxID=455432 RepID=UPI0018942E77|nr:serine/threonine-protein kinase [Nocardia terpenica]MBF6066263.1 protein kinase [Nocardia terpenica]MBF6109317.1 protein kinase [Nocardia terpenica]MBF6116561.1 protein kinase [Nocardia terpenica]MBF6123618.1 protein kinase [Nocardia terpenica]MBF6156951.1 protein kinase [Nocardia terpenica]
MIAGHYRLVERIGSGGTGVVWRAVDERLERSVAIKQILTQPSLPAGEKEIVRQRASREARNAARFQHPNAIVVFDITDHEGDPCLVMEYLPSKSLAVVLSSQGTLPMPQVARIGEQVASALVAAHRAGIVHRDVKPGNVLLGDNGTVKITDFGISKAKGDVTLTATGLISGTAAYLAPEVARGADPTPAADVFALGATLFHALEGEPPYGTNPNPLALLYAAANGQLSQPRNAGPLTDLLLDLLSFEPEDRPSMIEIRDHLADFADYGADSEPTHMLATHRSAAPRSAPRRQQAVRTLDRRAAQADISTAEMMATAAPLSEPDLPPVRPAPPASHPTRSHPVQAPEYAPEPEGRNRKSLLFAIGFAVGLVIVAGVLYAMFSSSGSNAPASQGGSASTSAPASGGTTTPPTSALGQTKSAGKADLNEALKFVKVFYDHLTYQDDFTAAWNSLTPAAQQVYGSQQAFQSYWKQHPVQNYRTIDGSNNSDGSLDMNVASVDYQDGQSKSASMRVVMATPKGPLLIDSDIRE